MAKLELSRSLSMTPEDAWEHASDFSTLGDWLSMHQGWRGELPDELEVGTTLVGVAGVKGMRNRVTWTVKELDAPTLLAVTGEGVGGTKYGLKMTVKPTKSGCDFTVRIDLGGAAAVRAHRRHRRPTGQGRHRALDREVRGALHLTANRG